MFFYLYFQNSTNSWLITTNAFISASTLNEHQTDCIYQRHQGDRATFQEHEPDAKKKPQNQKNAYLFSLDLLPEICSISGDVHATSGLFVFITHTSI